jgi:hypothetical protein
MANAPSAARRTLADKVLGTLTTIMLAALVPGHAVSASAGYYAEAATWRSASRMMTPTA